MAWRLFLLIKCIKCEYWFGHFQFIFGACGLLLRAFDGAPGGVAGAAGLLRLFEGKRVWSSCFLFFIVVIVFHFNSVITLFGSFVAFPLPIALSSRRWSRPRTPITIFLCHFRRHFILGVIVPFENAVIHRFYWPVQDLAFWKLSVQLHRSEQLRRLLWLQRRGRRWPSTNRSNHLSCKKRHLLPFGQPILASIAREHHTLLILYVSIYILRWTRHQRYVIRISPWILEIKLGYLLHSLSGLVLFIKPLDAGLSIIINQIVLQDCNVRLGFVVY